MSTGTCVYCGDSRTNIPKMVGRTGIQCENIRACNERKRPRKDWYIEAPDVPEGAWRKSAKGAVGRAYKMWQDNMARVRIVEPNGRDAGEITSGGYFVRVSESIRKHVEALDNR